MSLPFEGRRGDGQGREGETEGSSPVRLCLLPTEGMINKGEGIILSVSISRLPPTLELLRTAALFVCGCPFGWTIPSTFLLLFFSFSSQLTFCVSFHPTTTTAATTFTFGPSVPPNPNPPASPLKSVEAKVPDHHVDPKILIPLIFSAVFLFLFIMAFFTKLIGILKLRHRPTNQVGVLVDQQINIVDDGCSCSVKKYCWDDIDSFTNNFSQVMGSGGFSNVYLARLPGSTQGAVKIHSGSKRLNYVFKQELEILLHLRHHNIVKLLGYCNDRDEGALVFEYISNGTLQEKLHGASEEREYVLPWRSRMAIAFQLAQAIEYLHEKCSLHIVHGDIKASNILLDENLNCKLCDFGSAKMGFSSTVLQQSSSSPSRTNQVMIGSPGYTDPHYLRSGIASRKNDVYSFGVLILELVTGLEAFCPERGQLISLAGPMLKDAAGCGAIKVAEMVDPRLVGNFDLEEAMAMLSISSLCLRQSPILRPSATQILHTMKDKIPSISFLFSPQKESQAHSQ